MMNAWSAMVRFQRGPPHQYIISCSIQHERTALSGHMEHPSLVNVRGGVVSCIRSHHRFALRFSCWVETSGRGTSHEPMSTTVHSSIIAPPRYRAIRFIYIYKIPMARETKAAKRNVQFKPSTITATMARVSMPVRPRFTAISLSTVYSST